RMAQECRDGSYRPHDYRVIQFFPNIVATHVLGSRRWYVLLQQHVPLAHDRTLMRGWCFQSPFPPEDHNAWDRLLRMLYRPGETLAVRYYWSATMAEDHGACERMQAAASQMQGSPMLGTQERRIAWFEEAYAKAMAAGAAPASG